MSDHTMKQVNALQKQAKATQSQIDALQEACSHEHTVRTPYGPGISIDRGWNKMCLDCDKCLDSVVIL